MDKPKYEQKDMTGVLFFNGYKDKETQPDYKGTIKVEDKEYQLAAWIKKTQAGNDFYSLSVSIPKAKTSEVQDEPSF